jgi:hypothetical protein
MVQHAFSPTRLHRSLLLLLYSEEALYASIQEQGEYVHDIVAVLAQQQQQQQQQQQGVQASQPLAGACSWDCSDREEQVLDALSQSAINDLRIQHALLVLGKGRSAGQGNGSGGSAGELRSTACLRAALTADNIAWARWEHQPRLCWQQLQRVTFQQLSACFFQQQRRVVR